MGVEHLEASELQMVHANLHRFYPRGINGLGKKDIEQLHTKVKEKLVNHQDFDQLDKVNNTNE
jgi:hypothetical protein